jgi:exodeoxyribonuclease VII small subunit
MNFEQAFQRLDEIVQRLEQGDLPLEESLALYEEGMTLAAQCNDWLDQAELRVRQLVPAPFGGEAGTGIRASDFNGWDERAEA